MTGVFAHLWSTPETDELFGDEGRTRTWLSVYGALAAAQGELGLIPAPAAEAIAARVAQPVDLAAVGEETRRSGHSTLGLIRVLGRDLDESAREWVSYGATVQDVADTWTGLVAQRMLAIAERDLAAIESSLAALAVRHRDAVGTLSAWGEAGPELQRRVLERLGLGVPDGSWLTARDRVAELIGLLALVTGTLAKVGNEVYNLQRPEIGELAEAPGEGVVGSITMPQKRNPERSEHLSTLARVVRGTAGTALEGMVAEHERDGAAWKTEWALLPQACGAAAVALALAAELAAGLRVDEARMRANVDAQRGYVLAEPAMLALGAEIGPRRAHELVHAAAARGRERGLTLAEALAADPEIARRLPDIDGLLRPEAALGSAGELTDRVIGR